MSTEHLKKDIQSNLYLVHDNKGNLENQSKYNSISRRMFNQNAAYSSPTMPQGNRDGLHKKELELIIKEIKDELHNLINEFSIVNEIAYTNEGSDLIMEQLKERLNDIDKKVSVLEERTKHLDKLPSKDEMARLLAESKEDMLEKIENLLKDKPSSDKTKLIVDEVITSKKLASEQDVELQVTKARNVQIIWTVSTLTLATGIIGLLIKFL